MLTLFKPWRTFADVRGHDETWEHAYQAFYAASPGTVAGIIEGAQFQYVPKDAADAARDVEPGGSELTGNEDEDWDEADVECDQPTLEPVTVLDIEQATEMVKRDRMPDIERLYALQAVGVGHIEGVFDTRNTLPMSKFAT